MIIRIHSGNNEADPIIREYEAIGSFDQVIAGAKVNCSSMKETKGKEVWVRFINRNEGTSTTRILNES